MSKISDTLLLAGGFNDPNMKHLQKRAIGMGLSVSLLLIKNNESSSIFWDLNENKLTINNNRVYPSAVFMRRDVFYSPGIENHDKALAWYTALSGWLGVNDCVKMLNRDYITSYTNKLMVLNLAVKSGFAIPKTYITNTPTSIKISNNKLIAKPVMGGGYCHNLGSIIKDTEVRGGVTANPAIVQQLIKGNDIRIYRVYDQYFGFSIIANNIDYRRTNNFKIEVLDTIPKAIIVCLSKLMDQMSLNWGAADFKKCNKTGEWYFLEVNSDPMFSVFDDKIGGKISGSIFQFLLNTSFHRSKNKILRN